MLDWHNQTYIMGILNLTPDSFSGDGTLSADDPVTTAMEQAKRFVADGAHILDLGAESSRPGSRPVTAREELDRLLPVLNALVDAKTNALISIDTYKAEVAEECLAYGADWINDIWGLQKDPRLAEVIATSSAPVVLMHNRSAASAVEKDARLGASYDAPEYEDFMAEIKAQLTHLADFALSKGIAKENIILDPGIGFGKSVEQNLQLINRLDRLRDLGYPLLIGPSRKSYIGRVLDSPVEERLAGTAASIAIGIARGANIIRVHNVQFMSRLARMTDAILKTDGSASE